MLLGNLGPIYTLPPLGILSYMNHVTFQRVPEFGNLPESDRHFFDEKEIDTRGYYFYKLYDANAGSGVWDGRKELTMTENVVKHILHDALEHNTDIHGAVNTDDLAKTKTFHHLYDQLLRMGRKAGNPRRKKQDTNEQDAMRDETRPKRAENIISRLNKVFTREKLTNRWESHHHYEPSVPVQYEAEKCIDDMLFKTFATDREKGTIFKSKVLTSYHHNHKFDHGETNRNVQPVLPQVRPAHKESNDDNCILAIADLAFICVPGSHTLRWNQNLHDIIQADCDFEENTFHQALLGDIPLPIVSSTHGVDPLNFINQQKFFIVPAGYVVVCHKDLCFVPLQNIIESFPTFHLYACIFGTHGETYAPPKDGGAEEFEDDKRKKRRTRGGAPSIAEETESDDDSGGPEKAASKARRKGDGPEKETPKARRKGEGMNKPPSGGEDMQEEAPGSEKKRRKRVISTGGDQGVPERSDRRENVSTEDASTEEDIVSSDDIGDNASTEEDRSSDGEGQRVVPDARTKAPAEKKKRAKIDTPNIDLRSVYDPSEEDMPQVVKPKPIKHVFSNQADRDQVLGDIAIYDAQISDPRTKPHIRRALEGFRAEHQKMLDSDPAD